MNGVLEAVYVFSVSVALLYALFDYRSTFTRERVGSGARGMVLAITVIVLLIATAHAFDRTLAVSIALASVATTSTLLHHYTTKSVRHGAAATAVASLISLLFVPAFGAYAFALFASLTTLLLALRPRENPR